MSEKIYTTKIVEDLIEKHRNGKASLSSIFYNGEWGFRKSRILFQHTEEEIEEILKCELDIVYFAENYCKILNPYMGERLPIIPRGYQKELLLSLDQKRFNIAAVSRQSGLTLIESISLLHSFIFKKEHCALIVDVKHDIAREKLQKVKDLFRQLPFFMQPGIVTNNSQCFRNENGSQIKTQTIHNQSVAIGYTVHQLHWGNFAYSTKKYIDSFFKTVIPCISSLKNGKVFISSTPNGNNHFYEMFAESEKGKNNFYPHRIYWWQVPGRGKTWKEQEIKRVGKETFDQEYDLRFFTYLKFGL